MDIEKIKDILLEKSKQPEECGHWIGGFNSKGRYECDGLFCYDCCKKIVDRINKRLVEHSKFKSFVDGGWLTEEDGVVVCEGCSEYLDYSLACVESELSHYAEVCEDIDLTDGDQCHQILQVLEHPNLNDHLKLKEILLEKIIKQIVV